MIQKKNFPFVALAVVLGILFFGSLVRVSLNLKNTRRHFQNEMAQRLDLEEKIAMMDKARAQMLLEIEALRRQSAKAKTDAQNFSQQLKEEQKVSAFLKAALDELKKDKKSPMSATM